MNASSLPDSPHTKWSLALMTGLVGPVTWAGQAPAWDSGRYIRRYAAGIIEGTLTVVRGRPCPPLIATLERLQAYSLQAAREEAIHPAMLELDHAREHRALGLTDEQAVDMYRFMLLARRLDDRMWALNRQGRVPFVVSVSGHEGTQVGAAFALDTTTDWALPYYRDTALNLALGVTPDAVMLGLFSKADDPTSGGRQMPNHWSEPDLNIFTHSSVIATQFPHACGIAYQLQAQGGNSVVLVSSGEGATSEGDWHEAMNFAGIHQLPIVFLVQNNRYAISVPVDEEVAGSISARAAGYRIPGVEVDGNNTLDVYGAVSAAVERARSGQGPTLVEAHTYRYYAHTSG